MNLLIRRVIRAIYLARQWLDRRLPTRHQRVLPNVAVSLTTYPARVRTIDSVLRSILRQSCLPQVVYLVLSRTNFPERSTQLRDLHSRIPEDPRIQLLWTEGDLRSYKKLIPVLEERKDWDVIVTADDDVLYPRDWLDSLLAGVARWPGSIVGTRGAQMIMAGSEGFEPYSTWRRAQRDVPRFDILLTGRGGIAYPTRCLHEHVTRAEWAITLAPDADDLWFKAMALLAGSSAVVTGSAHELPGVRSRNGLHQENVTSGNGNDRALRRLDSQFQLRKRIETLESRG